MPFPQPINPAVKHPIVEALGANRAVLLSNAAPIEIVGASNTRGAPSQLQNADLVPTAILLTTNYSWAESDLRTPPLAYDPKVDKQGPLAVGFAVAERVSRGTGTSVQGKPRLVLFSCPAMAENAFQKSELSNLDMLMISASWLRGRSDTLGIPPHMHVALTLSVDPELRQRLIVVPSVVALLSIIAIGIVVFTARRE